MFRKFTKHSEGNKGFKFAALGTNVVHNKTLDCCVALLHPSIYMYLLLKYINKTAMKESTSETIDRFHNNNIV